MQKTILIISDINDPEVDSVELFLKDASVPYFRFDTTRFAEGKITLTLNTEADGFICDDNNRIALLDIGAIWFTHPFAPQPNLSDPEQTAFAKQEMTALLEHLYFLIPHAFWLNNPHVVSNSEKKLTQLLLAKKVGMSIPQTIMTNNPNVVEEFIANQKKDILYKTLRFPYFLKSYDQKSDKEVIKSVPASIITKKHIQHLSRIQYTGGIFQPYVEKEYEIRSTVVGDNFFSAKIDSQVNKNSIGQIDFRRGEISEKTIISYTLPKVVEDKILTFMEYMGIFYGAFDFIKDTSGNYIFLEVNTAGSFYWIEKITGLPISKTIARELILNCG